jgi:hypothetical protein
MLENNLSKNEKSKQALVQWLAETHKFDYFITLATNNPSMERQTLREKLKEWDARVNRKLYGSKWHAKNSGCCNAIAIYVPLIWLKGWGECRPDFELVTVRQSLDLRAAGVYIPIM